MVIVIIIFPLSLNDSELRNQLQVFYHNVLSWPNRFKYSYSLGNLDRKK